LGFRAARDYLVVLCVYTNTVPCGERITKCYESLISKQGTLGIRYCRRTPVSLNNVPPAVEAHSARGGFQAPIQAATEREGRPHALHDKDPQVPLSTLLYPHLTPGLDSLSIENMCMACREFVIEQILDHRTRAGVRQFKVCMNGQPARAAATQPHIHPPTNGALGSFAS
jgi:hypothetical protein